MCEADCRCGVYGFQLTRPHWDIWCSECIPSLPPVSKLESSSILSKFVFRKNIFILFNGKYYSRVYDELADFSTFLHWSYWCCIKWIPLVVFSGCIHMFWVCEHSRGLLRDSLKTGVVGVGAGLVKVNGGVGSLLLLWLEHTWHGSPALLVVGILQRVLWMIDICLWFILSNDEFPQVANFALR